MKKNALILAACLALGVIGFGCRRAQSAEPAPPSKFEQADADALYRVFDQLSKLEAQAQPLAKKRDEIFAKYKIDPAQVGKTIGFNLNTLEIQRAGAPSAASPDGGTAPKK